MPVTLENIAAKLDRLDNLMNSSHSAWLTIDECCGYLKVGKTKLRELIKDGRLKHYRLDGQIRIHRRDCDSLLIFEKSFSRLTRPQKQTVEDIHG